MEASQQGPSYHFDLARTDDARYSWIFSCLVWFKGHRQWRACVASPLKHMFRTLNVRMSKCRQRRASLATNKYIQKRKYKQTYTFESWMQESSMAELSVICLFASKQISEKPGASKLVFSFDSSSFNLYFWNWICNKGDPHSACIFFLPIFTLYFNSTYPTTKDTNIQTKIKTNKQTNSSDVLFLHIEAPLFVYSPRRLQCVQFKYPPMSGFEVHDADVHSNKLLSHISTHGFE